MGLMLYILKMFLKLKWAIQMHASPIMLIGIKHLKVLLEELQGNEEREDAQQNNATGQHSLLSAMPRGENVLQMPC